MLNLVCQDLDRLGYKRVILRSDGEAAIVAFLNAVKKAWDGEATLEQSPAGESQSNGAAEKAVQLSKSMFRSTKFA